MTDQWLPISDAAHVLGISVDAARRRVRSGTLGAEKRTTPQGGAWWVLVPDGARRQVVDRQTPGGENNGRFDSVVDQESDSVEPVAVDMDQGAGLVQLVASLTVRLDEKHEELIARTEAAAMWQARAEMLSFQLQEAQQTVKALEAPKVVEMPQEEPETAESREVVAEASPEHREPWWRRFWQLVSV